MSKTTTKRTHKPHPTKDGYTACGRRVDWRTMVSHFYGLFNPCAKCLNAAEVRTN